VILICLLRSCIQRLELLHDKILLWYVFNIKLARIPSKCVTCNEVAVVHGYCDYCWDLLTGSGWV
jgi:hypothetical protein